jgi:hypothetical protein
MKCQRCKTADSTGVVIALCDPCFDEFEREIQRNDTGDGRWVPTNTELEYFNEPFVRRAN